MHTFDLFLVSSEPSHGLHADGDTIVSWLSALSHLKAMDDDPTRLTYYNRDTTVHFNLILHPSLLPANTDEEEEDGEVGSSRPLGVLPDEEETREPEEEYEQDDEEEDELDDPVDLPPLALNVPLFRPTFFIEEALEVLEKIRMSAGLLLLDPQEHGAGNGEAGQWTRDEVVNSWQLANLRALPALKDRDRLSRWSTEKCQTFYAYASRRAELQERYAEEGLDVPQLHPATHEGEIKTLCVWRTDTSAILPRSDLVLIQKPRERRGLLGKRKIVLEEGLVAAEDVWKALGPFAEIRREPAQLLVFRRAEEPPAQVTTEIERLALEPVKNARRTELAGVVDFELEGG